MLKKGSLSLIGLLLLLHPVNPADNNIETIAESLATFARVINGIGIQWSFSTSLDTFYPVISELLKLSNDKGISNLVKVDVDELPHLIDSWDINSTFVVNTSFPDVEATLKMFDKVDLKSILKQIRLLRTTQNLQNLSEKLKELYSGVSFEDFYFDGFSDFVDDLNYILTTKDDSWSPTKAREALEKLRPNYQKIIDIVEKLDSAAPKLDDLVPQIFEGPGVEVLKALGEVAQAGVDFDELEDPEELVKEFEGFRIQISSVRSLLSTGNSNPNLADAMENLLGDAILVPKHTAGLPRGMDDLEVMIEDLSHDNNNSLLLRKVILGDEKASIMRLAEGLIPLITFSNSLEPLKKAWTELQNATGIHDTIRHVGAILKASTTSATSDLEILEQRIRRGAMCLRGLANVSDVLVLEPIAKFSGEIDKFKTSLTKIRGAMKTLRKEVSVEDFRGAFAGYIMDPLSSTTPVPATLSPDTAQELRDKPKILEVLRALEHYVDGMRHVNLTFMAQHQDLGDFVNMDPLEVLDATNIIKTIQCYNRKTKFKATDYQEFFEIFQHIVSLRSEAALEDHVKEFMNVTRKVQATEKKLRNLAIKMRVGENTKPAERDLLLLPVADLVARDLGNGVRVIREMNQVLEHNDLLMMASGAPESVDRVLNDPTWNPLTKKSLRDLVAEVREINSGAKDFSTIWEIFTKAQSVSGTNFEFKGSFIEALNGSNDSKVVPFIEVFRTLSTLPLDFTGEQREDLRSAAGVQTSLELFFNGYFEERGSPSYLQYYIRGGFMGAILLLAIAAVGYAKVHKEKSVDRTVWATAKPLPSKSTNPGTKGTVMGPKMGPKMVAKTPAVTKSEMKPLTWTASTETQKTLEKTTSATSNSGKK